MDYQQAIDYLSSYTDYEVVPRLAHTAANYDLRRVEELLARVGSPQHAAKSVHIAGTNGKGSTAAMVASALTAAGYVTGLYTSPHLHSWCERIRIGGEMIAEAALASLVSRLRPEIEAVNDRATYGRLTTFELLTTLAFAHFAARGAQFQVLEVGMGGKFDATNIIVPEVCVITSISLDHTEVLGDTLAKIAAEKAAIIKPGCTAVVAPQADEADSVVTDAAASSGAGLVKVGRDVIGDVIGFEGNGQRLLVRGRLDEYEISLHLLGRHQLVNATTAVAALEVLQERGFSVSRDSIIRGLETVDWAGRMQLISHRPLIVVDGAHNPDGARQLREALQQYFDCERVVLVTGLSDDKDIPGVVAELAAISQSVIVTRAHHPRAGAADAVVGEFAGRGVTAVVADDVPAALSLAIEMAGEKDLICVAGSLFIVAEAITEAQKRGLSA